MPRPLRDQFAGATYHLMARGVRGAPLYTNELEPARFLQLLAKTCERYDWLVHAYCLMGNHYHLLATTRKPTVSRGMQWLNSSYARSLNTEHDHEGHAFFRRFHSVLIKKDAQLAYGARYILLNPVRARPCDGPADWDWSSYRATMGEAPAPAFLSPHRLLTQFGLDAAHVRSSFAAFMREAG